MCCFIITRVEFTCMATWLPYKTACVSKINVLIIDSLCLLTHSHCHPLICSLINWLLYIIMLNIYSLHCVYVYSLAHLHLSIIEIKSITWLAWSNISNQIFISVELTKPSFFPVLVKWMFCVSNCVCSDVILNIIICLLKSRLTVVSRAAK